MKKMLMVVMTLLLLAACATIGKDFNQADIASIKVGETTKGQTISMFGNPTSKTMDHLGNESYTWVHSRAVAFGGATSKTLMVFFNKEGVVERFNSADAQYGK